MIYGFGFCWGSGFRFFFARVRVWGFGLRVMGAKGL